MNEERISEFKDISIESLKNKNLREQRLRKKINQNIQGLWDNDKRCIIHVVGVLVEEERKEAEEVFETMISEFSRVISTC